MGLQIVRRLSCDGPACDLTQELPEGSPQDYIHKITIARNGHEMWTGYLCPKCEQKQDTAIKALLRGDEQRRDNADPA